MASLLRQIVAGPRARHPEANLDLCYVTDNIIATSGPGATYPQVAYRNPLKDLVKFLDSKHGTEWSIWEFRAEGTGYPDSEVYNRIRHYPWPDHHPPPFALIPLIMGSMRNWLKEDGAAEKGRVAVVHCKAGKGRSGTVTCSYLISEEGWGVEEAKKRFTERRMRPGFGNGVSIPSQVRWLSYVDRWNKHGKIYVEQPVEVMELHVWGLRDGVKIAVEGFVEEGKVIKNFHMFSRSEREIVRGEIVKTSTFTDVALEAMGKGKKKTTILDPSPVPASQADADQPAVDAQRAVAEKDAIGIDRSGSDLLAGEKGGDVIFRPSSRVVLPSSDLNIDFERRNKSKYGGFTVVTSVAHVWINTFFEGHGPELGGRPEDSGVFEIEWDAMDGIKGSSRKGTRAFDRIAIVWKHVDMGVSAPTTVITEPGPGEDVQTRPADWRGSDDHSQDFEKKLGLRQETTESAAISRASSMQSLAGAADKDDSEGVKSFQPDADDSQDSTGNNSPGVDNESGPTTPVHGLNHLSTDQLPGGKPVSELGDMHTSAIGSLHKKHKDEMTAS